MTSSPEETERAQQHPAISALRDAIAGGISVGSVRQYREGDLIMREGEPNDALTFILEGSVLLLKGHGSGADVAVGTLEAGASLGLLSYYGGGKVFFTARAKTGILAFRLRRNEFDSLPAEHPRLFALLESLIIRDLAHRYQRILHLHYEVAALTRDLEADRNQLRQTLDELQSTRNRLIHQEKMAILGQLVAGIAHELNNPASALLRGAETIAGILPSIVGSDAPGTDLERTMLLLGRDRSAPDTAALEKRIAELETVYPSVRRSLLRTLAQIPATHLPPLTKILEDSEPSKQRLEELLQWFEIGMFLRNIEVAGSRIGSIVASLKGYSRQSKDEVEQTDVRKGIQDTLLMLGNRLKNITVRLTLDEVPPVFCRPGEINQVWTNVILNACDAMHDRGVLEIRTEKHGADSVAVQIADTGPGIPPDILPKVFEPNFTTKTASGSFGLGLGLAISNEIVRKHGGSISLANREAGGTVCLVVLPVSKGSRDAGVEV
ncbi:MAG: cyclic nucleotide-binding domain-containing protein [Bacteroidetes bacterium]|nr:cyclic nucleotide-binding domain-containing protein [Bacteroidota bacterium]